MCLIFLSLNNHPDYKLIVAANRDEFYNRKTAQADFWPDQPETLGGRDLEAGGTWLGITRKGKISRITNYRDLKNLKQNAPSRGHLVSEYLANGDRPDEYLRIIEPKAKDYNGFNLIVGTTDELWYLSNYREGIEKLPQGKFGLSNSLLETPWPKVQNGKKKFAEIISGRFTTDELFALLLDDKIAPDDQLPDTGVGLDRERVLSSMFIKSPGYGTRCSTVITIDKNNKVAFSERVFDLQTFNHKQRDFTFKIQEAK